MQAPERFSLLVGDDSMVIRVLSYLQNDFAPLPFVLLDVDMPGTPR